MRSREAVGKHMFFNMSKIPVEADGLPLDLPEEDVYILRMPIMVNGKDYYLPEELEWVMPMLEHAASWQHWLSIRHSFCYITIRKGKVVSETDDEWHVDGFSTRITHLPEQNYIWCSNDPTEFANMKVLLPVDFDPLKHNVNKYLQNFVKEYVQLKSETVYLMDPYMVHRRPPHTKGIERTFIRITFAPIEINDINNTPNRELPRVYDRDGVEFRDSLEEYPFSP